jgi:hypothetical protein
VFCYSSLCSSCCYLAAGSWQHLAAAAAANVARYFSGCPYHCCKPTIGAGVPHLKLEDSVLAAGHITATSQLLQLLQDAIGCSLARFCLSRAQSHDAEPRHALLVSVRCTVLLVVHPCTPRDPST